MPRQATEAYLLQILKHGFYHADPHPGNQAVDITPGPNQVGGGQVWGGVGRCEKLSIRGQVLHFFESGVDGSHPPTAHPPCPPPPPLPPVQGSLLFYDFGMMGEIVPNVRDRLLDVFYGVYKKDANQVIK